MMDLEETVREMFADVEMGTRDFLVNARNFAASPEHNIAKGMFKKGNGFCIGGFLLAGNGIQIEDRSQYCLPFTGELARFNEANDYLNRFSNMGNYQLLNDTSWMERKTLSQSSIVLSRITIKNTLLIDFEVRAV
jgi:hypothetical protein